MEYRRTIFGYECDLYGHLNNANYLHLYEEARADALDQMGLPVRKLMEIGIHVYIIRVEVDYIKGIPVEERVRINSEIEKLNKIKGIWKQEIFNSNGDLCSRARVTGVFIKNGKAVRLPEDIYDHFRRFQEI